MSKLTNESHVRYLGDRLASLTLIEATDLRAYLIDKLGEDGSAGVLAPLLPNEPPPSLHAMANMMIGKLDEK